MPRASVLKTNFTAGEISPRLLARTDINRYANGARELYNVYCLTHGGANRRPGLRFVAAAKEAAKTARLVPFVFNRDQAFMLEFGHQYIRFYTGAGQVMSGGVPYEISTAYTEANLAKLRFVQSADTLFITHPNFQVRKLVRYSNTDWRFSFVRWFVQPSTEAGDKPNTTLTLSATSGAGVTATAGAAAFLASNVGRYIESGSGSAKIVGFTDTTHVTVDVDSDGAFASVGPIAAGSWTITESPKTGCTPSAAGPVGVACTLTLAADGWKNDAQQSDIGKYVEINGGLVEITGVTSALIVAGTIRTELTGITAAPSESWALRSKVWTDALGYPHSVGIFDQRLILGGSDTYPSTIWGSRPGEYFNFAEGPNDADAFSFTLAADQISPIEHIATTRVLLPLTFGGEWSVTGGVEKPLSPANVQAKMQTVYGCSQARPVRIADEVIFTQRGGTKLRALGYRYDKDAYGAPDVSILAEHITGDGITDMAFAQEPDNVAWMTREDGHMVAMTIDRDQEVIGFTSGETDGEVEAVAVMPYEDVDQVWWLVKREIDGSTVRYVERFDVDRQTDCCVTGATEEQTVTAYAWAGGTLVLTCAGHGYATDDTVRLSDFSSANDVALEGEHDITVINANSFYIAVEDDPGVVTLGTVTRAEATWSDLDHLEGKEVQIVADGYVATSRTVSGGEITLARAAYEVEIGLGFESRIKTLPPEFQTGTGTAQGNAISVHEVVVRFHKTKGGKVNGQPLTTRRFGTGPVLNQPIAEFTGDKRVQNLGWGKTGDGNDSDGSILITQDQPLPMQVLGVVKRLTVND